MEETVPSPQVLASITSSALSPIPATSSVMKIPDPQSPGATASVVEI